MTTIKIIINYINSQIVFNKISDIIVIQLETSNNSNYKEQTYLQSSFDNYNSIKKYFFNTSYPYPQELMSNNFIIYSLNKEFNYYYDNINYIIYIYANYIEIPYIFLGSINNFKEESITNSLTLNYINGLNNIDYINTINIPCYSINPISFQIPGQTELINTIQLYNSINFNISYSLYDLLTPILINSLLQINFYDYTFIKINNIIVEKINKKKFQVINFLIEINGTYSFLINLNLNNILNSSNNSYVLHFPNYSNINTTNITLHVFDYIYTIYFSNLTSFDYILCNQITLAETDLYTLIIANDNNLVQPIINDLSIYKYELNFQCINLNKTIQIDNLFNLTSILMNTKDNNLEIIVDYLSHYDIINYNIYCWIDNYDRYCTNLLDNFLVNGILMYTEFLLINKFDKINYKKFLIEQEKLNKKIYCKCNNSICNISICKSNCNNCNIINNDSKNECNEISYYNINKCKYENYDLYLKILNNNDYQMNLLNKSYDLSNNNKKQLIQNLLIILLNYFQINIYFYNNKTDFDNTNNFFKNNSLTNPFLKFNKLVLNTNNSSLGFKLDTNYYLKFFIKINCDYKILIFNYVGAILNDILIFESFNNYFFKIFKISPVNQPNGSPDPNNNLYYIVFQNIKECNEFLNFINTGILYVNNDEIKSFFNINKSSTFFLNSNNYYVINNNINTSLTKSYVYFEIKNLNVENNYIFSNNFLYAYIE